MKPPVELSRPTILNIAAIFCYCLAMLFHIISYATDSWSSLKLEGVTWTVGLWHGCRHDNDTWVCTTDVFQDKVFKTGSDWHTGSQVMMTFAFVALFLLEFAIIGYSCVKRLERYKSRLVGIILALSGTAGILTIASLAWYGSGVVSKYNGNLEWSYGIGLLSIVFQIICAAVIVFDRHRTNLSGKLMRKSRECISSPVKEAALDGPSFNYTNTVVDLTLDDQAF